MKIRNLLSAFMSPAIFWDPPQERSRRTINRAAAFTLTLTMGFLLTAGSHAAGSEIRRDILPPPAPEFKGKIGTTYKDSVPDFGPALPLAAPAGAPNVLVIVLDDVGFGQLSSYGGPHTHAEHRPAGDGRAAIQ